jgi:hypothetical protein
VCSLVVSHFPCSCLSSWVRAWTVHVRISIPSRLDAKFAEIWLLPFLTASIDAGRHYLQASRLSCCALSARVPLCMFVRLLMLRGVWSLVKPNGPVAPIRVHVSCCTHASSARAPACAGLAIEHGVCGYRPMAWAPLWLASAYFLCMFGFSRECQLSQGWLG